MHAIPGQYVCARQTVANSGVLLWIHMRNARKFAHVAPCCEQFVVHTQVFIVWIKNICISCWHFAHLQPTYAWLVFDGCS